MFGYITINQEEMKVRELKTYKAWYCGLCHALHLHHGRAGQLTLSYDMTFLAILLNGLYEQRINEKKSRCPVHPLHRHDMRWCEASEYAADMNILLTYYNLMDDWHDDRRWRSFIAAKAISKDLENIKSRYLRQAQAVEDYIRDLSTCESEHDRDIEKAACLTGRMLAEIFVKDEDEWSEDLRQMGFFLGKFIYLMDAYEDVEKDLKSGGYNPLLVIYEGSDFENECRSILMMQMAECCKAFERLPIVTDVGILRNILYSGVWTKYSDIYSKKNRTGDN